MPLLFLLPIIVWGGLCRVAAAAFEPAGQHAIKDEIESSD